MSVNNEDDYNEIEVIYCIGVQNFLKSLASALQGKHCFSVEDFPG